ncbi:hypothetical protein CR513_14327, partial [Mucuna pruriens]
MVLVVTWLWEPTPLSHDPFLSMSQGRPMKTCWGLGPVQFYGLTKSDFLCKLLVRVEGKKWYKEDWGFIFRRERSKRSMEDPNIDWENLSPWSKVILSYVKKLGEKLGKVSRKLESIQKDTQNVNAKVEALSKEKEERHKIANLYESEGSAEGRNSSDSGRSS